VLFRVVFFFFFGETYHLGHVLLTKQPCDTVNQREKGSKVLSSRILNYLIQYMDNLDYILYDST